MFCRLLFIVGLCLFLYESRHTCSYEYSHEFTSLFRYFNTKHAFTAYSQRVESDENMRRPQILQPVLDTLRLSYTGNETNDKIKDLKLISTRRFEIGLNALAYEIQNPSSFDEQTLILITFRGTKSVSDECADLSLWPMRFKQTSSVSKKLCKLMFTAEDLDYISQGTDFYKKIKFNQCEKLNKKCSFLFTGHSLGAAIAQIISVKYNLSSFVLSSPGVKHLISQSVSSNERLKIKECNLELNFIFDPVVRLSQFDEIGIECQLLNIKYPISCRNCYKYRKSTSCQLCFNEAHLLNNYLNYFKNVQSIKTKCINN